MRTLALLPALALALSPALARPQASVRMQVEVRLPAAPPLVVVQPGIQVVEDWDEEVFFTGGFYWVARDGRWYRSPRPGVAFVYVEPRRVPPGLLRLPPGHYRHYRKAEERAERRREKAERKAWKEREKAERKERREHGKRRGDD